MYEDLTLNLTKFLKFWTSTLSIIEWDRKIQKKNYKISCMCTFKQPMQSRVLTDNCIINCVLRDVWRAVYAPGDGQTSPAYSSQPVQYLNINRCYPLINQCCHSSCCACLHSGDPYQVVPFVLCTVLLYTQTHMSAAISASCSLFRLRKWFCFQILQFTLHRLQLSQFFSLAISLRDHQIFPKFSLSVGSKQRATATLDFEHCSARNEWHY
jgi:hypothetical protein